jgi:proton-dependent oligopeptide transporter, POT family
MYQEQSQRVVLVKQHDQDDVTGTKPLLNRSESGTECSPRTGVSIRQSTSATAASLSSTVASTIILSPRNNEVIRKSTTPDHDNSKKLNPNTVVTHHRTQSSQISEFSDDIPNNVSSEEQLEQLPSECLSGDVIRPLQHFGEDGAVSTYALRPMFYSVIFILLVELLERFAFYGINYTQTSYLTGEYDYDWNAGMDAVPASSYVSVSVAVAYTTPFIGAILADSLLGDYYTIILGSLVFYIPGLLLIACTTVPGLLGSEFNKTAVSFGLLLLWPCGTGIVKSVVNVFGAKQFHPLLQSSLIEAYYVKFYMCINIGALIGGIVVPVLAQDNVTDAYFLPVTMLTVGIGVFLLGSSRYVRSKPNGTLFQNTKAVIGVSNQNTISVFAIAKVSLLTVPFSIVYNQMSTTFIIQGNVMKKSFGWIDAATMNNADAVAVLLFGSMIGSGLYPWLSAKGIKIPTTYKFAIGSGFGALSISWALMVDGMIHKQYAINHQKISVLWQAMAYVLIGIGEIFAVSAAYEVAFTASPPEKKVLFSAVNLFCIGGLPSVFCIVLYQLCRPWFMNSEGTTRISYLSQYATAHVDKYFWILFVISLFGVFVNLLPSVRQYVESIEDRATDMIRTPKTPIRPPHRERDIEEEQEALKMKRHQYYLKYGSGPSLYKSGSMRAGPSMKSVSSRDINSSSKRLPKTMISKLYQSEALIPNVPNVVLSPSGKPMRVSRMVREEPPIRSTSNL